jgi:hypothetical protein
MSVNRERFGTAEDARKGFRHEDWGVVSVLVKDLPPRVAVPNVSHSYLFRPRHVPHDGNFAHSEVRVWKDDSRSQILITERHASDFDADDPDAGEIRANASALDPNFHMRWRKRIEWCCRSELRPSGA